MNIINDAIYKQKCQLAEIESSKDKKLTNLTFNYKLYKNYTRRAAEIEIDGDPEQNHFIALIDYLVDPCIQLKNYIVA